MSYYHKKSTLAMKNKKSWKFIQDKIKDFKDYYELFRESNIFVKCNDENIEDYQKTMYFSERVENS